MTALHPIARPLPTARSRPAALPRRRALAVGLGLAALAWVSAGPALAQAAAEPGEVGSPISAVEQWLFLDAHLKALKLPATLNYAVDVVGEIKPADHYEVQLALQREKGAVAAKLITPRVEAAVPVEGDLLNNPIVAYFLDRDVETMQQLTGGKKGYFHKRLRMALARAVKVDDVRFDVDGKSVAAQQVSLQPYLNDPLRPRFERFAGKRYRFTLAKSTPGQVLRIETVIPGANNDFAKPLLTETLVFEGQR